MYLAAWMLFLLALSFSDETYGILAEDTTTIIDDDLPTRQNDKFVNPSYPYVRGSGNNIGPGYTEDRITDFGRRCSERLEDALDNMRRRQAAKTQKTLHLNGYTLHQQLRSVPYDMYVTDMRVRLPSSNSWVRVDNCRYNPRNNSLETRLLFNDLTISGKVALFNEGELQREPVHPNPDDSCNMILRLRRAGIGFHTEPIRRDRGQFNVRTDSHFLEPGFISVYAYGCDRRLHFREHRRNFREEDEEEEDLSREMEDIFLKGIRSLLTTYMQKELQPAIKETLMTNMGYTLSYG
ncbi:PREDICTED: uncharacterized protein LOC108569359 [Nicrophorus vespilloides]|uniref:Uncharacterized protein LOC108569359 n=1 Tax=Nicrophorus vespilloides TaxID=110193 RepID=A0ABM1NHR6_NICVS|nr:PREDICTED: uncharacterized protein LOC108569359 [Nicrophorus vespilloides]